MSRRFACYRRPFIVGPFATLVLLAGGCFTPHQRPAHTYPGRGVAIGGGVQGGLPPAPGGSADLVDEPRKALGQVDQYLRSQGYTPTGPAIRNSNMPEGGVVAYAIDARRGACYAAIAVAQAEADLNMVVLDPEGRTVSYNVDPDRHPWATLCPHRNGRYVVRLQMASGSGEYYYAAYQGSAQSQPNLAGFFGKPQETRDEAPPMGQDVEARLATLDEQLSSDEFVRSSEARGVLLSQTGERDRSFGLNLEQGTCYAFASLAGQGIRDTDVFITDGGGQVLAADDAQERDGLVRYCADSTGAYKVRARVYEGEGPVYVAAWTQVERGSPPPEEDPDEPVMDSESASGAGLEENFRLLDSELRARGYESYGEPSRGHLNQAETRNFGIHLDGGKCYAILAVGDNGVRDLDLLLLDQQGRRLDRDIENDARPVVRVCPKNTGEFQMQVRMYNGSGNFVYAPYRWPRGTRGPFGLAGLMYVRVAEVTALLSVEGYSPDPAYTPQKGRLGTEGQSRRHSIELGGGECYSILVVGGEGVADLDVNLSKSKTQLASDGSRNAFPNVRHCPESAGTFNLNVKAATGSGAYYYQVFKRE
jgi:hypothetical protein